ncbi:hypothetical protein HWV62_16366 [Athelia sp. TMB]|nr:hypothetical protein HWV62_16366 [Athelia sp. TMB]
MVPNSCGLHDAARTDVHMIAYFHGIVVEVPAICLIWRSALSYSVNVDRAVPQTWVSSYDGSTGDDGLPTKDYVLRSGDRCTTGDFVPCVLRDFLSERTITFAGVITCPGTLRFTRVPPITPNETITGKETIEMVGTLPSVSATQLKDTSAAEYQGPLSSTFRRLKLFSVMSFGLSAALSPIMFIIESSLPMGARASLAGIAISTSGISTLLVSWCGSTYVTTLRHLRPADNDGIEGLEMTTLSLFLRKRVTRVYDVDFLVQTTRPFAKWELAETVAFGSAQPGVDAVRRAGEPGEEETVAETISADGEVTGRWIVRWEEGGVGRCRKVGSIIRHFNVHEELLT